MQLKVFRGNASGNHYDVFEVPQREGMTVLEALFHVQDRLDDSLAFRYSCRGAVCGSCSVLINKMPALACRTQVAPLLAGEGDLNIKPYPGQGDADWDRSTQVLVEPLPHMPVVRDLIVDMTRFFDAYRKVRPVFEAADEHPEKERRMDHSELPEMEKFTNCILCASCYGSCPVNGENEDYLGPAALAKLYRFHIDSREKEGDERLLLANDENGWWGCDFHGNCRKVCPKGVPPNYAIGLARKRLKDLGHTGDT